MKVTETMMKKPSDMVLLSDNPRKITKADMQRLVDSIRINGFWLHRPLAVEQGSDGKFVVLCGNQRLKAAKKLKLKEIPVVVYSDLTKDERADLILRDNINNGDWDSDVLLDSDTFSDVDLDFIGLDYQLTAKKKKMAVRIDPCQIKIRTMAKKSLRMVTMEKTLLKPTIVLSTDLCWGISCMTAITGLRYLTC